MLHSSHQIVRIPDTTLIQQTSGESVLLSLENESYFGLDEMGTEFWNALTTSSSVEIAISNLLEGHDVEESALREDMQAFLKELVDNQLVQIDENAS